MWRPPDGTEIAGNMVLTNVAERAAPPLTWMTTCVEDGDSAAPEEDGMMLASVLGLAVLARSRRLG